MFDTRPSIRDDSGAPAERTPLRPIALTVQEPTTGCFQWVLMESSGQAAVFDLHVARGEDTFPSYGQALKAGYEALVLLSQRSKHGPRALRASGHDTEGERGEISAAPKPRPLASHKS